MQNRGPSFGTVLATVIKIIIALVLIAVSVVFALVSIDQYIVSLT